MRPPGLRPVVFGSDLDGVVYDLVHSFRGWMAREHGWTRDRMPTPTRWEFYLDWQMGEAEFWAEFARGTESGFLFGEGRPMPGAVDALARVVDAGHELHLVTARPPEAEESTRRWLAREGIRYTSLTLCQDKTEVAVDVFADDNPGHYSEQTAAGVDTFLIAAPDNLRAPERADAARRGRLVPDVAAFVSAVLDGPAGTRLVPAWHGSPIRGLDG
jgi:hypothetical protein